MRDLVKAITILSFVLVISASTHSQTKEQKRMEKVFAPVPLQLRARLVERLNSYVEYERTQQYEKLYDLSLESVASPITVDRDAYVEATKKGIIKGYRSILLKFKPTWIIDLSVKSENPVRYHISGISKEKDNKGKVYERETAIEVRWIRGDWYFSGLWDVIND